MSIYKRFIGRNCAHEFEFAHLWPIRLCFSRGLVRTERFPEYGYRFRHAILGLHLWYYGPHGATLFGWYWSKGV